MKIGSRIKEIRNQKGMTQEDLAVKSDITIRTIQRIESGEVDPRSFTLQAIASALEVDYSELTSSKQPHAEKGISSNDAFWVSILHFSGILLTIIPTVIIYTLKRERIPNIRSHAIETINFQLSMILYLVVFAFFSMIPITIPISETIRIPVFSVAGMLALSALGIYIPTIVIFNTAKSANHEPCKYYFSAKFLKNSKSTITI